LRWAVKARRLPREHGFPENGLVSRLKTALGNHVNVAPKELPELPNQGHLIESRRPRGERDQEVDVTIRTGLAPNDRPEKPDTPGPVPLGELENAFTLGPYSIEGDRWHASRISTGAELQRKVLRDLFLHRQWCESRSH
jgi:hypothetical protein